MDENFIHVKNALMFI